MENQYTLNDLKITKTIKGEENESITSILKLKDGKIAVCCKNQKIKIYDPLNNNSLVLTIPVDINKDSKKSFMIQLENGHIGVCSEYSDKLEIFSYTQSTSKKEYTIIDENKFHIISPLTKNRFASISGGKCKIWKGDLPYQETPITVLNSQVYFGDFFQLKDKEVLLLSDSFNVYFWDINENKLLKQIEANFRLSWVLQIDDELLVSPPKLINLKTEECSAFHDGNSMYGYFGQIKLRDNRALVCGKQIDVDHGNHRSEFHLLNPKTKETITRVIDVEIDNIINIDEHTFATTDKNSIHIWKY